MMVRQAAQAKNQDDLIAVFELCLKAHEADTLKLHFMEMMNANTKS
jgi:hypothetical protein